MIGDDWIKIYSAREVYKVELAKQKLEENEIDAVVINKRDSAYLSFGEAELYVQNEHEQRAKEIIEL